MSRNNISRATELSTAGKIEELTDAPGGGYMVTLQDPEGFPINLFFGQTLTNPGPYPKILEINYETEKPRVRRFQRFQPGPAAVHKVSPYMAPTHILTIRRDKLTLNSLVTTVFAL
jgi:hypothetical protein